MASGGGVLWMALSALAFSVMTLLARTLAGRIPGEEIILVRTVITLVVTLAMLRAAGVSPVLGRHRLLLLLRGAAGFVALDCLFYAVARLPLAEATVLQYLNPVLVTILAAVFLGERITRGAVAALSTCVAGVLLVARPAALFGGAASALDPLAVAAAVAGAAMSSVAYLAIRAIGRREHPLVVVLYLPLVSLPTSLAFTLGSYVAPTAVEWATLAGIGIATQVGQVALTNGLQREAAGRATTVGYLQIAFAGLWGVLFLGEIPSGWSLAGALLIVGGVVAASSRGVQRGTESAVMPEARRSPRWVRRLGSRRRLLTRRLSPWKRR